MFCDHKSSDTPQLIMGMILEPFSGDRNAKTLERRWRQAVTEGVEVGHVAAAQLGGGEAGEKCDLVRAIRRIEHATVDLRAPPEKRPCPHACGSNPPV